MKKLFVLFLITTAGYGQSLTEAEKVEQIGLVWGLVKYHHPNVSRGKYDWNREFLSLVENSEEVSSQADLNDLLYHFVTDLGGERKYRTKKASHDQNLFLKNEDYGWINGDVFSADLLQELEALRNNSNIGDHYATHQRLNGFLDFENEEALANFDYSNKQHRLLLLYNFWNTIQYWYVNKYLMEEDWREVLSFLTQEFIDANTLEKFEIAKLKMISKINDSHSYRTSPYLWESLYNHSPALNGKIVNDSLVVIKTLKGDNTAAPVVHIGDVITEIEEQPVKDYVQKNLAPLFSTSNKNYLRKRIQKYFLLSSNIDSLRVKVFSPETKTSKDLVIPLYTSFGKIDSVQQLSIEPKKQWYDLTPNVTYINLDTLDSQELKAAFKHGKEKEAIVLDLRNYPIKLTDTDFSSFLYPRKKKFLKVLFPLASKPSYGDSDGKAPLRFILDPFKTGRRNKEYYKGKVILLVDRTTMSKAEFLAMAIQGAPNVITIGEQTAGAPLNIWSYRLVDGQDVSFTGLGGFYPDGTAVQGKGIRLDYEIKESAANYDPNLYIKEALRIIAEDSTGKIE